MQVDLLVLLYNYQGLSSVEVNFTGDFRVLLIELIVKNMKNNDIPRIWYME